MTYFGSFLSFFWICLILFKCEIVRSQTRNETGDNNNSIIETTGEMFSTTNGTNEIVLKYLPCSDLENKYICIELKENDFDQVFAIALIFFLIHLGYYFLEYPTFYQYSEAMEKTRDDGGDLQDYIVGFQNNIDYEKFVLRNNFGGLSTNLYIILNGILSTLYFVAKVIFFDSHNSVDKINITFNNLQFKNWVNAEFVIILYLFVHSCLVFGEVAKAFHASYHTRQGTIQYACMIALFACFIDSFASLILICIKWSLLILCLYMIAVVLVVSFFLMCTLCCVLPLIMCWICSFGMIFRKMTLFFTKKETRFSETMDQIGVGLAAIGVIYLYHCLILLFAFLFLHEDGPSSVTIYINSSSENQLAILWLHGAAAILGAIFFMFGIIRSYMSNEPYQVNSPRTRKARDTKRKGRHARVDTRDVDNHAP